MRDNSNFRVIDETDKLVLGNLFEDTCLVNKSNGKELLRDYFYGDPKCGLISSENNWAIVAGEHITVWIECKSKIISRKELRGVMAVRRIDATMIELLVDPWGGHAAIWRLNLKNMKFEKTRDFENYRDKEYTDKIEW